MTVKTTNNAYGTLAGDINNSVTTINLSSGQGAKFPSLSAGEYFYGTLIAVNNTIEIVKVTARSSDALTVTRAQDNTSASAFSTGDRFELRPTAALFNEFVQKTGDTIDGDLILTGDSYNVTWDKSQDSLEFADTARLTFGDDRDFYVYHAGSATWIGNYTGTVMFDNFADDEDIIFRCDSGIGGIAPYITLDGSEGEVLLAHYGTTKLATKSTGIDVTGTVTDDGATHDGDVTFTGDTYNVVWDKSDSQLEFPNNAKLTFGDAGDLTIHHEPTDSVIRDTTGHRLWLQTDNNIYLAKKNAAEYYAVFKPDAEVELYYDNYLKFTTTTSGIAVTHAIGGIMQMHTQSTDVTDGDRIGMITFSAPNEHADDGNETAASIKAEADGTFDADNNPTDFVFSLGTVDPGAGTATEKMRLHHEGNLSLGVDTNVSAEIGRAHVGYMGHDDWAGLSHIDSNGTASYAFLQNSAGYTIVNASAGQVVDFANNNSGVAHVSSGGLYMYPGKNLYFEGATNNNYETTLTVTDPTADRTITLPNETGTLATQTHATGKAIAMSIVFG